MPPAESTNDFSPLRIERTPRGRLVMVSTDGNRHKEIIPVRAFPITAPDDGISLVGSDGHELMWLNSLTELPPKERRLVEDELNQREFVPNISAIHSVSSFNTPSTWDVQTDRGKTTFVLRGEEDIRRIGSNRLLISDNHGVQFQIHDLARLDRHSRQLLDRFL